MDILCEVNDKKSTYRLSVTRPTSDAAVLWLDEKESSERWFCNIPFDLIGDSCENSESFNHAPSAVIGLVEDAIRAATSAEQGASDRFSAAIEPCSAYCMSLEFSFKADESVFNWVFSMLPEDAGGIQDRNKLRPIAAIVEDPIEKLDSFQGILERTQQRLNEQEHGSTTSPENP